MDWPHHEIGTNPLAHKPINNGPTTVQTYKKKGSIKVTHYFSLKIKVQPTFR